MRIEMVHILWSVFAIAACGATEDETAVERARGATTATHTEVEIAPATLPTTIVTALAGKGTIDEAEVIVSPGGVHFEVEIGNTEYLLDAAGTILGVEQDDGDDDDDSDDAEGDDD